MTIFLILAPSSAFAFLMLVTSSTVTYFASATICLAVIALDVARRRSIKVFGAGSAVLFPGCAATSRWSTRPDSAAVNLAVDADIFLI